MVCSEDKGEYMNRTCLILNAIEIKALTIQGINFDEIFDY